MKALNTIKKLTAFTLSYKKILWIVGIALAVGGGVIALIWWKRNRSTKNPLSVYSTAANLLWEKMRYTGTEVEPINDILSRFDTEGVRKVYEAFGTRPYNITGAPDNFISRMLFSRELNLIEWLDTELSQPDFKAIMNRFPIDLRPNHLL